MEWLWYIIASVGAGVGTGLAGLSAATVMVPILIVLCPSFGGETGAYQATAIALASDILGSAVTARTYAKHKNIDLKRGWIMLVCIIAMCTVGSYAAFLAGNAVLGGFTLFLTFFIGIRFLVKPDTQRENMASKGEKLDLKGVTPWTLQVHGILQARILEWVVFPFSRESSQPRDRTQVSCIAGGFFTS